MYTKTVNLWLTTKIVKQTYPGREVQAEISKSFKVLKEYAPVKNRNAIHLK